MKAETRRNRKLSKWDVIKTQYWLWEKILMVSLFNKGLRIKFINKWLRFTENKPHL